MDRGWTVREPSPARCKVLHLWNQAPDTQRMVTAFPPPLHGPWDDENRQPSRIEG